MSSKTRIIIPIQKAEDMLRSYHAIVRALNQAGMSDKNLLNKKRFEAKIELLEDLIDKYKFTSLTNNQRLQ